MRKGPPLWGGVPRRVPPGARGCALDRGAPPRRTFIARPPSAGVTLRASHVRPVRSAVPLPVWTKRRHVDLCRTHGALCS
ncbi:putative leader peptide [Streptomyces tauricus]|uniref:putative leader peptide n=1 Tax=Streptomyces tauricus TaxID=68274 RepID=UPI00343515E8